MDKVFNVIVTYPNGDVKHKKASIGGGSGAVTAESLDAHYQRHPVFPPGSKWVITESEEDIPADIQAALKKAKSESRRTILTGGTGVGKPRIQTKVVQRKTPLQPPPTAPEAEMADASREAAGAEPDETPTGTAPDDDIDVVSPEGETGGESSRKRG